MRSLLYGLVFLSLFEPSHTHFTAAGTIEVGKRFAEALLGAEKK
jgi:hypothetical protein